MAETNVVLVVISILGALSVGTMVLACYRLVSENMSSMSGPDARDTISDELLLASTPRLEAELLAQQKSPIKTESIDAEPLLGSDSIPSDSKNAPMNLGDSPRSRFRLEGIVAARRALRARRWCGLAMCFTKLDQLADAAEIEGAARMARMPTSTCGGHIELCAVRCILVGRAISKWAERTAPVRLARAAQAKIWSWIPVFSRIFGILLFYADLLSDLAVCVLLLRGGQLILGYGTAVCIFMQFWVTSQHVNQYLDEAKVALPDSDWFGSLVSVYRFLGNGVIGTLFLDLAMIFEPMAKQILAGVHSRDAAIMLAEFWPAYVDSRTLIAGTLEAIPLAFLQGWLLCNVNQSSSRTRAADSEFLSPNAGILSLSVSLSMINLLFTWTRVISVAQESGIRLGPYLQQLARIGSGLPFDAIVRNTLASWRLLNPNLQIDDRGRLLESLSTNRSLLELDLRALECGDRDLLIPTDLHDWHHLARSLQIQADLRKASRSPQLRTLVLRDWGIPIDLLMQNRGERLINLNFASADAAMQSTDHEVLVATKKWLGHRQHPDGRCLTSSAGRTKSGMAPLDAFVIGRMLAAHGPGDLEFLKLVFVNIPVRSLLQDANVLHDKQLCDWGTAPERLCDLTKPICEGPHPIEVVLMATLILPPPAERLRERDDVHRVLLERMSAAQCNHAHLLELDDSLRHGMRLGVDIKLLYDAAEDFMHKKRQFKLLRVVEHHALLEDGAEPPQHDLHRVTYNLPRLRVALHAAGCADELGRPRESLEPTEPFAATRSSLDMLIDNVSTATHAAQMPVPSTFLSIPRSHLELPLDVYRRALFLRRVKDECLRPYRKGWGPDAHVDCHALQLPLGDEALVKSAHSSMLLGDQSTPHEGVDAQLQQGYGQRGKLMQLLDLDVEKLERAIAIALQANVLQTLLRAEMRLLELAKAVQGMKRAAAQLHGEMGRISRLRDPHPPMHELKAPMDALMSSIDSARATKLLDPYPTLFFNRDYEVSRKLLDVFQNESGDLREIFPRCEGLRRSLVSASKTQLVGIDAIPAVPKEFLAPAWDKLDQARALKNVHDEARCELRAISEHDRLAGALKLVEEIGDPVKQTNRRTAQANVHNRARRSSISLLIEGGSHLLSSSSSNDKYAMQALLAIDHEIYRSAKERLDQANKLHAVEAAAQKFHYGRNADSCRLKTYADFVAFTADSGSSESLGVLLHNAREAGVAEELLREADEQLRRADALRECLHYCDVLQTEGQLPKLDLRNLTGISVALDRVIRVYGSAATEDFRFMMALRYRAMLERIESVRSTIEGENRENYEDGELDLAKIHGEVLEKHYRSAAEEANLNVVVGGVSIPIFFPGIVEDSLKFNQLSARVILSAVQCLDRLRDEDVPHDQATHEELLRDFVDGQRNPRTNQPFDIYKLRGACEAVAELNASGMALGQGATLLLENALAKLARSQLLFEVDAAAAQSDVHVLLSTLEAARDGGVPPSKLAFAVKVLNRLRLKSKIESDLKLEMPPPTRQAILAATLMLEEARMVDGHQAGAKTERMLDPSRNIISKAEKLRAIHEESSADVPDVSIPRLKAALDEADRASTSVSGIRLDDKLNTPNSIKLLQHAREKLRHAQKYKSGEAGQKLHLEKEVNRLATANKALERNLKNVQGDLTKAEKSNNKLESKVKELQGAMRGLGGA